MRSGTSRTAHSRPARPDLTAWSSVFWRLLRNWDTTSMFTGLSSMYRMLMVAPAGAGGLAGDEGAARGGGAPVTPWARGRVRVKADPSPRTLDALSWPP